MSVLKLTKNDIIRNDEKEDEKIKLKKSDIFYDTTMQYRSSSSTKSESSDEASWEQYKKFGNSEEGAQGYQKYLADIEASRQAAIAEQEDKKWWEKLLGYYLEGQKYATDNPVTSTMNATIDAYRNDVSYMRPSDDWSEEQRNIFGYLYSSDPAKAYKYAEEANNLNNKAKEDAEIQKIQDSATSNGWAGAGHTAGAIATAPLALADFLNDLAMTAAGREIASDGVVSPFEYSQAVTEGISEHLNDQWGTLNENIPIIGGKGWGDVYGLGTSIAQSAVSGYTLGGAGTLISYFGQGAASGVDDALSRGASEGQAILYGTVLGVAEGLAEKIGIDNLFKLGASPTLKVAIKNILKQAGAEGMEEGLTSIISNIADNAIMQDQSNFNAMVRAYMEQGMTEDKAKLKAWMDSIEGIAFDTLGGAISGGVHAGVHTIGKTAIDNYNASKMYGDSAQDLLSEAIEIGGEAASVADKYSGMYEKRGKLSGAALNELVYANEQELMTQDRAMIKSAVEAKLTEYGETGDVSALAEVLVKQASGEKLTSKEVKLLNQSKAGHQVSGELNRQNLRSGSLANDWAADIGTERINADVYNRDLYDLATQKVTKQGDSTPKAEGSIESKFKVSESGNTTVNGEEISIKEISSVKNGDITLRLENGETVNANDVEFGSEEEMLYATVVDMNLNAETANAFIRGFNATEGLTAEQYALGFKEAYRYGSYGFPVQEMSRDGFSASLSESQKSLAYGLGKVDAKYATEAKQNAVKDAKVTNKVEKNTMSIEEAEAMDGLTDRQRDSIQGAKALSDSLGVKIRFFESAVGKDGKRVGKNGWYDPETGIIYIDLHAGAKGEGTILFTAAHELTHHIRQWSPAKFKVFADFLLENYGKKGISVDALVRAQIDKAKRNGRDISYDTAYEEVIADSCEAMLADGDAISKIAKLKAKDRSLWKKIKDFITDLVAKIKEAYKGLKPDSFEGREVAKMLDVAKQLQTLWTEALIDAGENYSEVRSALGKDSVIEVNENGEFTVGQTKDGTVLFNDRTYDEGGREALRETLIAEGFSADDINAALTIIDAKHDLVKRLGKEFSEQDKVNKATLTTDLKDGHAVLSALVSNGDYPVNIDLLMVCKKRLAYQRVINRLCETGLIKQATLDSLAIAEINKILGKYGFETACLGCFVESRRIRIQEWAETICKEWNGIVDKMVSNAESFNFASETFVKDLSNKEVEALSNDLESAYERDGLKYGRQAVVKKMEQLLREVPSLRKRLSVADLITPQGRTHIKALSAELNSLIACRYGSNTPKIVQDFNPYNHELTKYGKVPSKYSSLREYLYAIGGARMQSFSDFIIENWFDYCQIVADLTARKLPMHTYTKEIALVKLFGMTGIKINMSLIPDIDRSLGKEYAGLTKNAKGEYELIWADKDRFKATGGKSYMQSINFADAIALQADTRYSSNVGTIAVGISNKHIEMMLDDSRIRMIIPYHSSGMNPIFAQLVGTDYYKDYTDVQNTRVAYLLDSKGNRRDLKLEKSQKDNLTSGFEFNETLQRLGDARATAQAYLDWCADASKHTININGETYTAVLTPKFDEFAYHDNYYKLLEDFNTYDSITEQAAPQGDVQQIYPDEFEKILTDELKDREAYRQKQEPKWETAMGEIEDYLKKHTKADTKAYAKEHGIKLSKKDLKLSDRDSYAPTFYSYMGKVIDGIKLEKMGASGVVSYLKGRGVKDEEIKWSGIETFLEGKKSVTKAELQEFVAGSQLQIEEEMGEGGASITLERSRYGDDSWDVMRGGEILDTYSWNEDSELYESDETGGGFSTKGRVLEYFKEKYGSGNTRWEQYKLDGGTNYRELVFKMPNSSYSNRAMRAHWGEDAEGILAHARIQDLTTADGKNMLFIEEIQSDLHNEGRGHTYEKESILDSLYDRRHSLYEKSRELKAEISAVQDKYKPLALATTTQQEWDDVYARFKEEAGRRQDELSETENEIKAITTRLNNSFPDAPFKDTYHEYVLKRLLRMAAEEGYDSLGWTPSDIQADRWSYDYEKAYKIEYDQDIPSFLKKYGKKWGAKVGTAKTTEGYDVWSMDITDSMRDTVLQEGQVLYSDRVTDQETLDFLENQEHVTVYRAMQLIDGKLYPPMNAYTYDKTGKKVLVTSSEIGAWEQAVERPDLIDPKTGKFKLDKGKVDGGKRGTPIAAAYNPYIHTSLSMLNDQFTSAYTRSNLVVVKGVVPKSELTSGYHAQYAKDSVGETEWHSGVVSTQLPESRKVILSRWFKPVEVMDNDVVAKHIKKLIGNTGIEIPYNVVSPKLRRSLEKIGVPIGEGRGLRNLPGKNEVKYSDRDTDSVSNRSLLANALESVAQNDIEKTKLTQYKQKIALIESEQRKLAEIRSRIKELSFAKGTRDTEAIKKLQFEANQIANRINTYDKQLLGLESTKALKGVLEREKAMLRRRLEQKGKESLAAYREKATKTQRELLTRYQESRKKGIEGRRKTEMRRDIKKLLQRLNKLFKGGKERNVKEGMKEAVATALALGDVLFSYEISNIDIVNLGVESVTEKESKLLGEYRDLLMKRESNLDKIGTLRATLDADHKEEIYAYISELESQNRKYDRRISELNGLLSDVFARERARLNRMPVNTLIDELASEYQKLKSAKDDYIRNAYDSNLYEKVVALKEKLGGVVARDMSLYQLEEIKKVFTMLEHSIRTANQAFRNGKWEDLQQSASAVMEEIESLPNIKQEGASATSTLRSFLWNELTPYYAFDKIGSKTLMAYFYDLMRGQAVAARDSKEAKAFAQATREKYNYSKWKLDEIYEFPLRDGRTFRTTLKHLLSVYAYSKREQADLHMSVGGFFHNDKATFRKEKGILKMVRTDAVGYKVDDVVLAQIKEALGNEKMSYVDEMLGYLTKMGEKGNEVTRVLWGVDIFTEKVYFPLKSKDDFLKKSTETAQAVSLKNDGMTKETVPGASNPIVLEAFDEVWSNHVERMSVYHGFVVPIDNLNKIIHYGTWVGTDAMSVSTMLEGKFTSAATDYLEQFINDLNGGAVIKGATNPFMSFFGKFKKTAVGASLSTVVQQPTSIIRAMAEIDAKYFAGKPNLSKLSEQVKELQTYAPIAIIKEIGGFDAGGGSSIARWINADTATGIDKVMNTIDDVSMKGAEVADWIGWVTIWEAIKRETKATTNLVFGSKEFLDKCGERFEEVIMKTQVYDSTLSRSGFMRSKNDGVKMLTSFMGEPTLSINMIYNAVLNALRGGKEAKLQAAKTIGYVYVAMILAEALSSAIYALRDDDEDESYMEKYLQSLGGSVVSDIILAPITSLPGVKDIVSIFQGWDIERSDMAIFKDIKDAFDGLDSENKSTYRKVEDFAGAIAAAFGLPLKNVLRTGREVYNAGSHIFDDVSGGSAWDAFAEGITGESASNKDSLYKAIMSGDQNHISRIKSGYDDEKDFEAAVRKALRENDSRIQEAAMAVMLGKGSERVRIQKEIISEGHFKQDYIVGATNAEIQYVRAKIKEANEFTKNGKDSEAKKIYKLLLERGYSKEFLEKFMK